jgi:hypothetical protein
VTEPYCFTAVEFGLSGHLYRVARPGRAACGSSSRVPNDVVSEWLDAVHERLRRAKLDTEEPIEVDYVCLLGKKKEKGEKQGLREIADFYDARVPEDCNDKPLFEDLLNRLAHGRMIFRVHHFPTTDGRPVPVSQAEAIADRIVELLSTNRIVLVGCSAAEIRTVEVLHRLRGRLERSSEGSADRH